MAARLALLALVLATGCSALFGLQAPERNADASGDDAPAGPFDVGPDGCVSNSTLVNTCTLTYNNVEAVVAAGVSFNSDTKTFNPPQGVSAVDVTTPAGPAVVIAVNSVDIGTFGSLLATGSKPVILVARGTIHIGGAVNVSNGGAGARPCSSQAGQNNAGGAGGGAGGSFAGMGGDGGNGNSDGGPSQGGAAAAAVIRPSGPLGGCKGGTGGVGGGSVATAGAGGLGGGAIALVATRIEMEGAIYANGAGGQGGGNSAGGGGGGSGGFVLLEAPTIIITGRITTNGGGGGEGAGTNAGNDGQNGGSSNARALGGSGGANNGGDGGDGGAGMIPNGESSNQTVPDGGGGGGGAVGFIAISGQPAITGGALISPPYATWP